MSGNHAKMSGHMKGQTEKSMDGEMERAMRKEAASPMHDDDPADVKRKKKRAK